MTSYLSRNAVKCELGNIVFLSSLPVGAGNEQYTSYLNGAWLRSQAQSREVGEVTGNADLYSVSPPTYTQSITEHEMKVAADRLKDDKPQETYKTAQREPIGFAFSHALSEHSDPLRPSTPLQVTQELARGNFPLDPTEHAPTLTHYLTEASSTVSLVGARTCDILRDCPVIWLVRNNKMAVSPLQAVALVKEGLMNPRHLELDCISAIMLGVYVYLNNITLGFATRPIELNRQATPLLPQPQSIQQRVYSDGAANTTQKPAAQVSIETGKGMLRIPTASFKTPVQLYNGMSRAFSDCPKVWSEEVREYENVTGLKSGLVVSAKGAQHDGGLGFATGCGKGFGHVMFGIYKEIRNIKLADDDSCPADSVQDLGEVEYASANLSDNLYIVRL
ncbi:hypothetical protein BDU57DRAFT_559113 [Ampelomyces quisqualis]|uniref:Uncharacterized protein n=1 Tax=Ampelomyces quisqualis TaxID=50730 RepID=A0A6A5QFM9_AMPQU|nr:hypothetical protein BDU57DRAFT_559113 [Ampelomyces quisqualis]